MSPTRRNLLAMMAGVAASVAIDAEPSAASDELELSDRDAMLDIKRKVLAFRDRFDYDQRGYQFAGYILVVCDCYFKDPA